jgi:hypothetical protein
MNESISELQMVVDIVRFIEARAETREMKQIERKRLVREQKKRTRAVLSGLRKYIVDIDSERAPEGPYHIADEAEKEELKLRIETAFSALSEEQKTTTWERVLGFYRSEHAEKAHHDDDRLDTIMKFAVEHGFSIPDDVQKELKERYKRHQKLRLLRASIVPVVMLLVFIGIGKVAMDTAQGWLLADSPNRDISRFIEQNPEIVFKEVDFSKYLVWGRPQGASKTFEMLEVYHVTGTASVILRLESIIPDQENTDPLLRTISVSIPVESMIRVDVQIPQSDIVLVEQIQNAPIPEGQIEVMSTVAGAGGAVVGGWLGMKAGGAVGNAVGGMLPIPGGGVIGRVSGNILGGAGAGTAGYLATRNFAHQMLESADLSSNTFAPRDLIVSRAKPLIALEILGGASVDSPTGSSSEDLIDKYKGDAILRLTELFRALGWNEVNVDFVEDAS